MENTRYKKYCLVPGCRSRSTTCPNKIFITVPCGLSPRAKQKRIKWLQAIGKTELSDKTIGYICEDHFNLEEDIENSVKYKLIGGKIIIKDHVLPRLNLPMFGSNNRNKNMEVESKIKLEPVDDDAGNNSLQTDLVSDSTNNLIREVKLECDIEIEESSVMEIGVVPERTENIIEVKIEPDIKMEYLEENTGEQETRIVEFENQNLALENFSIPIQKIELIENNKDENSIMGNQQRSGKSNTSCCVFNCRSTYSNTDPLVKFYTFPTRPHDRNRREQWIKNVREANYVSSGILWECSKYSRICSYHFVNNSKSNHPSSPSYTPTIFPKTYKYLVYQDRSTKGVKSYLKNEETETDNTSSEVKKVVQKSKSCQVNLIINQNFDEPCFVFDSSHYPSNEAATQANIIGRTIKFITLK